MEENKENIIPVEGSWQQEVTRKISCPHLWLPHPTVISITFELASLLFIPILNIFRARKRCVSWVVNLSSGQGVSSGTL